MTETLYWLVSFLSICLSSVTDIRLVISYEYEKQRQDSGRYCGDLIKLFKKSYAKKNLVGIWKLQRSKSYMRMQYIIQYIYIYSWLINWITTQLYIFIVDQRSTCILSLSLFLVSLFPLELFLWLINNRVYVPFLLWPTQKHFVSGIISCNIFTDLPHFLWQVFLLGNLPSFFFFWELFKKLLEKIYSH